MLGGLVTGDVNNPVTDLGKSVGEYWSDAKSDSMKQRIANRSAAIDASPSLLGKAGTAIAETVTDPGLFVDTVANTAASMVPALGVASKFGTAAGVGMGAVQAGADVSGGQYDQALATPDAVLDANPEFQQRVNAGEDREAVKADLALRSARIAFPGTVALSALTQAVPGGATLERAFAGSLSRMPGVKGAAVSALKGGVGEATQEALEEGGGQFVGNLAQREVIDPNADLTQGVGEGAGLGAVAGFGLGGVTGALSRAQPEPAPLDETPVPEPRPEEFASQTLQTPPAGPPPGPLSRAAVTAQASGAAPAVDPLAQAPAAVAPGATTGAAPKPPLVADTEAQVPPAAPERDLVADAMAVLATAKNGKVPAKGKLAQALGVDGDTVLQLLTELERRALISRADEKGGRRMLMDPATGAVVDPQEQKRLDAKAAAADLEKLATSGPPGAAIAAVTPGINGAEAPSPLSRAPTAAFDEKMRQRQAEALARAERPDPTAGPTQAVAAAAVDTGASAMAEQQRLAAEQQQAQQQAATEQQRIEKDAARVQKEQARAAKEAQREQDRAAKQAKAAEDQARKAAAAAPASEAEIQAVVAADLEAGKVIDGLRMTALAKQLRVTPQQIDDMRVKVAQARKATAATASASPDLAVAPSPETAPRSPDLQISASAAPTPSAGSGQQSAAPKSPAPSSDSAYDTSTDQLDDDITPPSGSPWTIRTAAEATAKRTPGGQVFKVDGGFVVRVPRAPVAQSAAAAPTVSEFVPATLDSKIEGGYDVGERALSIHNQVSKHVGYERGVRDTDWVNDPFLPQIKQAYAAGTIKTEQQTTALYLKLLNNALKAMHDQAVVSGKAPLVSEKAPKANTTAPTVPTIQDSRTVAADVAGEPIDKKWTAFAPESGTLSIPRADMPQVKSEHRGAMVNYLNARGIQHQQDTVPADSLKPTQAEFSPAKVKKARAKAEAAGADDRSILVSADGHVLDGHHQWLAKREAGEPVKVIRLNAPIAELLQQVKEFPSSTQAKGAMAPAAGAAEARSSEYRLPEANHYQEWAGSLSEDWAPSARQRLVMGSVERALDSSLYYKREVDAFVANDLAVTPDVRASNKSNTEGGDFGYDVYYARLAVEAARGHVLRKSIESQMGLTVGDSLGTLVFNDGKVTAGARVEALDGSDVVIAARRGAASTKASTTVASIAMAMDRAKERGKRPDGWKEFAQKREQAKVPAVAPKEPPRETKQEAPRTQQAAPAGQAAVAEDAGKEGKSLLTKPEKATDKRKVVPRTDAAVIAKRELGISIDAARELVAAIKSGELKPGQVSREDLQKAIDREQGKAAAPAKPQAPQQSSAGPRVIVNKIGPDGLTDAERASGKAPYNAPQPSANTIFTDEAAAAAIARIKSKLGRLNSVGIDPEMIYDGIIVAGNVIEKGARKFTAYASEMVEIFGDSIKPYLKSWYVAVKYDPRAAGFDGMDSAASVESAVVDSTPTPAQDDVTEDSTDAAPDQPSPQALDSAPAEEGGGTAPAGETGVSPPGSSQTSVRPDSGAPTVRVPSTRGGGSRKGRVSDAETGATGGGRRGSRRTARAGAGVSEDDAGLTGEQTPETAQPPNIPAINFKIGDDTGLGKGGEVAKFKDNVEAIRTLKLIESERRRATPDEQRALARWVGWGGLAAAFPNPETGKFKDGWEQRGTDLRDMLTPSEYRAARRSTRNAHFTSEVVVNFMWEAVRRLGYRNGLALESSMGSGNFVGLMPDDLAARFIGVEYDSITARLAGALYPQATVLHSGFQDVPLPDGTFDLNIGNPPFGSESLRFQFKPELRGLSIHNQFFLASLDALKAGGLQVQVVSSFLMDAQDKTARQKLADKADLVAAFRLPDTAFKENARTEVVTDILILRKRASPLPRDKDDKGKELPPDYPAWVNTDTVPDPLGGEAIPVNTYFKANPDHIIGTMDRSGKMRAAGMMNVHLDDPSTLGARLKALLTKVPQNVVNTAADVAERTEQAYTLLGEAMRISVAREEPGHMALNVDGKLTRVIEREHGEGTILQRQEITADSPWSAQLFQDSEGRWYKVEVQTDDEGKAVKVADAAGAATRFNAYTRKVYATEAEVPSTLRLGKLGFERMTQLVKMRDLLKNQLVLETEDATKAMMEGNRAKLAAAYKAYVDQHGPVNRRATAGLVSEMPDGGLLLALESSYEPERTAEQAKRSGLPKQSEIAKPAAILSERVVPKYEPVTKAETPADALAITLAERGVVDIEHIAKLLGQSPEDAAAALTEGDKPLVFKDPELDTYETADAYLSGQVTRKLMAAQAAGLTQNAKALQAVQPERWGAENVSVQVGAAWVPPAVYADFATHLMGGSATASFSPITNTFTVAVKGTDKAKADQWGTDHMTGIDILSRLLNSQTPSVTYRDSEGKTHVDKEATTLAILKGREIVSEFGDWIFKDGARREQLVEIFNQKFNTRVSRQYDGQHLKLPGKVPDAMIQMRRHQKNAIWRGISSKFLLIDHVVGAGKTYTAIARAMERRRMGLAQKPTVVVPNHLVEQWQADVYKLYPGAKVLAATKKDFEKKNRRRLLSRVATGDYDIVILPHSSFGFVGISPETELRYLDEDLQQAIQAVRDAQAQAEEDGDVGYRKPLGVKEAERLVTKIQERMDKLREGSRDRLLTFEQLGIDDLTIDEAHEFKNLFYSSRLTKVRGMGDKVGSRKAADLYNKVRVVRDSAGSVVFMTGTPVSNSVVELYTMMRYLAAPELKELGMEHFDAWRSQFVDATPAFEPNEAGQLKEVTRLGRSWSNMRSLMDLYYGFTDAVTIDDIKQWYAEDNDGKAFPVPNVKGGDRQLRAVLPTPAQETVLEQVIAGFNGLDSISDQQERNAARLRLMDRARKLSLDVRAVDPRAQSKEEGGKLELLSAEVKRIYDRWTPDRGTQLVFLDRSVPKAKGDDKIIKEYDTIVARRDKALKDDDEVSFQEANEALERYDADEIRELRSAQAGGWNAYQQIKDNLVALGIPAAEIRFVQEANTDEQKQALFDAVNGGKVRVLIGSTPRMGAGTNVQKRLVALHHADVTWKPSDIEQRDGRIIRQGNDLLAKHGENFEVEILAYATERTVDAKMWSLNATKLRAINGLRKYTGDFTMEVEDSESVSMAEMAALASGNPLLLERVTLESEIANLELQEKAHRRKRFGIEDALERARRIVDGHPGRIEQARTQTAVMGNKVESLRAKAAKRSVVVEGKTYTDAKSAMKAALDAVERQQDGNEKARYGITINGERVTSKDAIDTAIGQAIGDHETFEVDIKGATYTQRTAGGRAAAEIISPRAADALEQPVSGKLGSMMGMDLLYQIKEFKAGRFWTGGRRVNIEVWLEDAGQTAASVDIDGHDPLIKLNTATMRDALGKLASRVESAADTDNVTRLESELARAKREVPELAPKLKEPFAKAQEITDKRARLNEVVGMLTANPPAVVAASPAEAPRASTGGPLYFRNIGGEIEHEPNGKKIELSAMPDGEFFIAPGLGGESAFEIMEATTGLRVGKGKSRKAAIDDALHSFAQMGNEAAGIIASKAFPKDKLDAAIAKVSGGSRASFAKSGELDAIDQSVVAAWRKLAGDEGLFQFKRSEAKGITQLLADVAPEIKVTLNEGDSGNVILRVPAIKDEKGVQKGKDVDAIINIDRKAGTVYIDVDSLKEGVHRGSAIYAAALNYAFNNNMVFIPDPEGVKQPAMIRRTEHMLSSALKFGTTRHMRPHPGQRLAWFEGNDGENLLALLQASADNVYRNVRDLGAVDYDWDTGRFVGASGSPFTSADFKRLSEQPDARAAKAGPSTLRRAVVQRSLARRAGTPQWAGVARSLLRLGRTGVRGLELGGLAYGRGDGATRRGLTKAALQAQFKRAADAMQEQGIRVVVVANGDELATVAPEVVAQADYDNTVQAAITGDRKTVYFVADRIRSPKHAAKLFAHEMVGHLSMEQMLGPKLFRELTDRILALRDRGRWPEVFAEVSRRYERNADGTFRPLNDATFASEAIAVFAEKNIQTSILQRALNAVRAWLRKLFPELALSQGELRQLLWESGQKLEGRAYRSSAEKILGRPEPKTMREAVERYSFGRTDERDTFYSALLRSIEEAKGAPNKASGAQWKQWLDGAQRRGEIKQSERDWVGVDAWLDGRDSTTRAELAEFVRANRVQVREVVLGNTADDERARVAAAFERRGYAIEVQNEGSPDEELVFYKGDKEVSYQDLPEDLVREYDSLMLAENAEPKFKTYQLPGGSNYKELLLTMPATRERAVGRAEALAIVEDARRASQYPSDDKTRVFARYPLDDGSLETEGMLSTKDFDDLTTSASFYVVQDGKPDFRSGHFSQPNILAHVRFNERADADGKRVLFVEEAQSDWHQEGRRKGYVDSKKPWRVFDARTGADIEKFATKQEALDEATRLGADFDFTKDGVPDAPLKREWPLAVMKRMLRYAAENGFDRVAWTTGDQQAERYDLSKQVQAVGYVKKPDGTFELSIWPLRSTARTDWKTVAGSISRSALEDHVGKEVAKRIADGEGRQEGRRMVLDGDNLKVGGAGMRAFYDKMLPGELAKYIKKWGGQVGETRVTQNTIPVAGRSFHVEKRHDGRWAIRNEHGFDLSIHDTKSAATRILEKWIAGSNQPSIDITPAMRAAVMQGQPLFAKGSEPTIVDRLQDLISPKDTTLLERIKNKLSDWRPAALGALQLRHLGELAERILPPVALYSGVVQRMATMRNELQELGHGVVDAGMAYQGKNPKEAKVLFRMLHDATLAGVDPAEKYQPLRMQAADYKTNVEVNQVNVKAFRKTMKEQAKMNPGSAVVYVNRAKEASKLLKQERARVVSYAQMAPRFSQLSPEAKALWVQMRDAYRAQSEEYEQALISRIQSLDFDRGQKAGQIAKMRLMFEAARVPFYVPLARWGNYWVSGTNADGDREFFMQESAADQQRTIKELTASGYLDIGHGVKLDTVRAQDGASASFMAEMDEMLKKTGAPDKIRDEAFQLYLRALPDLSIRKNFIHRQGTPGYSQDAIRALAGHIFHGSFQIARLRYSHELEALRTEAEDMARDMGTRGEDDANAAGNVVNELKKRHEWVMNPQDNALTNKISSLGFVYYLGLTPAAALVNLLQTPMVALPILAANTNVATASRELWRAMKQSMSTYGHMQKLLTGDELEAHAEFARRGVFDKSQAHNVAGISESDTHAYNPRWHKVMTVISHVFHKAEVVNREATAMAAYRLARSAGAGHIEAVETADRQVHESHFDFSNANRARFMQSGPAKVLLMFRQYSLAVTWLLGRNLYQSIKGEDAQTRREAKRKLAGVLGMTALFSGTLGLPMLGTVGAVLNAVAAAFGDDDEPWDWETELRAFMREMLGEQGAEAVLRGPVQALTGVGISGRVSMGDLWFREPDRELEGRAWSNYLFEQAAGPMGGMITNFFRGQQLMGEGHVWRGVETMMPKALKDTMKAIRYVDEGVNNMRGDPIVEDLNVFESLAQIAGFSPASVASAYDVGRDIKNYEQHIINRRARLMDAFALAWRLGDVDARESVLLKMRKFSQTYPELAITSESIRRSLEQRARASAQADNGVIVDKRIRARLEGQLGM